MKDLKDLKDMTISDERILVTLVERNEGEKLLIKAVQNSVFEKALITLLKLNVFSPNSFEELKSRSSKISSLSPFSDNEGFLRAGGSSG